MPPLRFLMAPKGWKSLGHVPPNGLVTVYGAAAGRLRTAVAVTLAYFGPVKKREAGRRFAADADVKQAVTPYYRYWPLIQALLSVCDMTNTWSW